MSREQLRRIQRGWKFFVSCTIDPDYARKMSPEEIAEISDLWDHWEYD